MGDRRFPKIGRLNVLYKRGNVVGVPELGDS